MREKQSDIRKPHLSSLQKNEVANRYFNRLRNQEKVQDIADEFGISRWTVKAIAHRFEARKSPQL